MYAHYSAFYDCTSLTDIYYYSTEKDWNNIYIDSNNSYLTNATKHYNYHNGDLKTDGKTDLKDIIRLKKILAGLDTSGGAITDLNSNGETNSLDLNLLKKFITGLITKI